MLVFLAIVLGVVGLVHFYLWFRLVRSTTRPGRWRRAGSAAVALAVLLLISTLTLGEQLPAGWRWLVMPGYVWLALMFYLLITLLVLEVPVLAAWLAMRRRSRVTTPAASEPAAVGAGGHADLPPVAVGAGGPSPMGRGAGGHADLPPTGPGVGLPPGPGPDPAPGSSGSPEPGHDPSRRLLLRRGAAITAGAFAAGLTGFGVSRAYRPPTVKRLDIPVRRLARGADGLRLAVLADLHVGPLLGTGQVQRMVEIVNGLDADVVAVVGDVVTSEPGKVRESLLPLTRMRGRRGVFYVTGNHEYYVGRENWTEAASELGLRVLRNERVEIAHGGGAIDLAGVNDITGAEHADAPDYEAALGDRDPSRPVVLMAHQPVAVHDAAPFGVDLQLSGHTHGGQVFPFHYLVSLQQPVVSGLGEVDGTPVYVTNGAGFWGPPVRVGADPDITLLTLRAAGA